MTTAPEPASVLPLAADFPEATHAQWLDLAAKVVNRGRPEGEQLTGDEAREALRTRTVDGLTIDPLYTAEGLAEADGATRALGHPGVMPFTRGTGPRPVDAPWDVRALHDHPDPAVTAEAILLDLERGVTSLWLEVGARGVRADDVARVLADVRLDLAPVVVSSADDQRAAARALLDVLAERGGHSDSGGDSNGNRDSDGARGGLGFDPLAHAARHGVAPEYGPTVEAVRDCLAHRPALLAITVDTRVHHDAGAGDVDELGLAVATGVAHVRELERHGVGAADAFAQIDFRVSATADQFLTIARLRALRRLWARVGEACGVPEKLRGARQHAVTSRRTTSRDDPYGNMLRGTIACFAAAVGGAEAVTVLPFDAAVGLPDVFSRRIARNTQLLLAQESSIGRVVDPAGGSWHVEALTDDLARAGWSWMQEIEAAGGVAAALADGRISDRLAATRAEREARVADRTLPLTGVSMFPDPGLRRLERTPRPAPAPGGESRGGLAPHRDSEPFERLRDAVVAHERTSGSGPTVPLVCLGAPRDYGAREAFAGNVLAIAGLAAPLVEGLMGHELTERLREIGSPVAVLCSSPRQYAEQGAAAAAAARAAGVTTLYLAGQATELGDDAGLVDATLAAGCDVVVELRRILADLGVAHPGTVAQPGVAEGERA